MMVITHVLISLLVSIPLLFIYPEISTLLAISAIFGGVLPDFDLVIGEHRKTLHYPIYGWVLFVPLVSLSLIMSQPYLLAVSVIVLGGTVHALSDMYSGGLEAEPWKKTSEKAVFSHFHGEWFPPKYYIPYDGAPSDLIFAVFISPFVLLYDYPTLNYLIGLSLILGGMYVLIRKKLPTLELFLYKKVPVLQPFLNDLH